MDSITFFKLMRANNLQNCYFFEGEEEYPKEKALNELKDTLAGNAFALMNISTLCDPKADELIAAVETPPWMAEKRLVIVLESQLFDKGTDDKDRDKIIDYIENLPQSCLLIFYVKGKANKTKKLFKLLDKKGLVVSFDRLSPQQGVKWVKAQFKANEIDIDDKIAEQLIFIVGNDLLLLSHEIAKLSAYAHNTKHINEDDIKKLCSKAVAYKVFDLTEALSSKKVKIALEICKAMSETGENALSLIPLMQWQYRNLFFVKIMLDKKLRTDQIAAELSISPWLIKKMLSTINNYTKEELISAYMLLVNTEFELKSGKILDSGILEKLIYELLGKRKNGRKA